MIQAQIQFNLINAQQYFREHLSVGDYYSENERTRGEWLGTGAAKLGLNGFVDESAFLALCEGKHPFTGEALGQRTNTVRRVGTASRPNRRIFYDFAIAPPKSVSIVALYQDDRILAEHARAVKVAMLELEKFADTRLRKNGARSERRTGNVVAATFRHDTSRELDPHLHTHCVVFNATYDEVDKRWTALEVQGMYHAQAYATSVYRHELCRGLVRLGYGIRNGERGFEIQGVPNSLVARFSKRQQQIDSEAERRLKIGSPVENISNLRKKIARGTRRKKAGNSTVSALRPHWEKQLTPDEKGALAGLGNIQLHSVEGASIAEILRWAESYLFERRSVATLNELKAAALDRGRGQNFDLSALEQAVNASEYVRERGTERISTRQALSRELAIVTAARNGRNQHHPLAPHYIPSASMEKEQREAALRILSSRDFITLFRGGAGTGKSFTLREINRGLEAAGVPSLIFAPQRQQVNDLRSDGLNAETISKLLATKSLPEGCAVIVDEAGQIGAKDLFELTNLVRARKGRIVLSGDTRQHGAVQASDALRAIERYGGLRPAQIRKIRRQDPTRESDRSGRVRVRRYRAAVKAAAAGNIAESFERLDAMGCIQEASLAIRRSLLTNEYLAAVERGEKILVVGQTRAEAWEVNQSIRQALQAAGKLGEETALPSFIPVDLETAKKQDPRFYQHGHWAHFLHRYGRFQKGDVCEILTASESGLVLLKEGRRSTVAYRQTNRLAVVMRQDLMLAPGDRLQLKINGKSLEGLPLSNGELVTVHRTRSNGGLLIEDSEGRQKTLAAEQCIYTRGYAVTSYASQGKTVDTVLLSDASNSGATSANQWYVSISRARKRVKVFTSDKAALYENVLRSEVKPLAIDLDLPRAAYDFGWAEVHKAIARNRHHRAAVAASTAAKIHQKIKL